MPDCLELLSALPLNECMRRLRLNMPSLFSFWLPWHNPPLTGWCGRNWIWGSKRNWSRNAFQTRLFAVLSEDGEGTHIRCCFGLSLIAKGIIIVTLAALGSGILVEFARDGAIQGETALIAAMSITIAYGIFRIGRFRARNERAYLLDFLEKTLEARPMNEPSVRDGCARDRHGER